MNTPNCGNRNRHYGQKTGKPLLGYANVCVNMGYHLGYVYPPLSPTRDKLEKREIKREKIYSKERKYIVWQR
jgi:hypothetical protein